MPVLFVHIGGNVFYHGLGFQLGVFFFHINLFPYVGYSQKQSF
jgi:hypothetical protein